jgi:hypothetical protein
MQKNSSPSLFQVPAVGGGSIPRFHDAQPMLAFLLAILLSISLNGRVTAANSPASNASVKPMATLHWLDGAPPVSPMGVAWGVPWLRGLVPSTAALVVKMKDGQAVPTQSWPLAFWPDGSVKWSGLAIASDSTLASPLNVSVGDAAAPGTPVTAHEDAKSINISTGPMQCRIDKTGSNFITSLSIDGREVGRDGHLIAIREDRSQFDSQGILRQEQFVSRIDSVTLEQSGPVRAVVRISGVHECAASKRAWLPFSLRLYFTAGLNSIRIVHAFIFDGDEQKDFIKGLGLAFSVPYREELQNRHIRFGGDADEKGGEAGMWGEPVMMSPGYRAVLVKDADKMNALQMQGQRIPQLEQLDSKTRAQFQTVAVWDGFKLTQLSPDSFSIDKRTGPASSWLHVLNGRRAEGFAFVGDVSGGLAAEVRNFWQKYPSALEVNGATSAAAEFKIWFWSPDAPAMDMRPYDTIGHDGKISYEDWQAGYSTPYGTSNRSELTLWAMPNTPQDSELSAMAKTAATPPMLVCTPEYYHSIPVFGVWSLPDRSTADKSAMETELDRAWQFYANEVESRRWYGFWDFGDFMRTYSTMRHGWMYDIGGHAWNNTELMADAWLWYTFLRTGHADAFRLAEAMTRNTSEVDVYHAGRFAGLGSRHNVNHFGCGAKEDRISEAYLKCFYYYLTADERTGDLMHEVVDADQSLPQALPLRHVLPRPNVPVVIRVGPDWIALASNWFTEWERTGDVRYRDDVLAGMNSLGAMPDAFAKRLAFGYDIKTKKLYDIGDPNLKTYEFLILFGGDEIAMELMQSIDCPAFTQAWNNVIVGWAKANRKAITQARVTAYAAHLLHDPAMGKLAWQQLRDSLKTKGEDFFPATPQLVESDDVAEPVEEVPGVNTPGTAQWALNIIETMELARDYYVDPAK